MHSRVRNFTILACFAAIIGVTASANAQRVIHVNADATGANDGTSWVDAYSDLQDALDDAATNGNSPCDIWIAEGTYKPDRGTGDVRLAFEPVGDISLYGGFAGFENCLDDRSPQTHPVILSGDLADDEIADPDALVTSNCCTDQGYGHPGCDNANCQAAVAALNVGFESCVTPGRSGGWTGICPETALGVCCDICRPTRCDNSGRVVRVSDPSSNVLFDGLTIIGGEGTYRSVNAQFLRAGGAEIDDGVVRFQDCIFKGNALWGVDVIHTTQFEGCQFIGNGSDYHSGGGAAYFDSGQSTVVNHCRFINNKGIGLSVSGPVSNSSFVHNTWGGAFAAGNARFNHCYFLNNGTMPEGDSTGAIEFDESGYVAGCTFIGNQSAGAGAIEAPGGLVVIDSLFSGNVGYSMGAIDAGDSAYIYGSTFVNNRSISSLGLLCVWYSNYGKLDGCIFGKNDRFAGNGNSSADISYTCTQGWSSVPPGAGNITADPLFVNPLGPDGVAGTLDDDLHLQPDSPALDAGDPNYVPTVREKDLDGFPRILCGRVDMGAYERGVGDFDCNDAINRFDFRHWPACATGPRDCNTFGCLPYGDGCEAFDFDMNLTVDLSDFARFETMLSAPRQLTPVLPDCDPRDPWCVLSK